MVFTPDVPQTSIRARYEFTGVNSHMNLRSFRSVSSVLIKRKGADRSIN